MIDPFTTLGVDKSAEDDVIREAYVNLVKKWVPDRYPEHFRKISEAYEKIKSKRERVTHLLFDSLCEADSPFNLSDNILRGSKNVNPCLLSQ